MRKTLTLTVILLLSLFTKAQFTSLWEKSAGSSYTWFSTSSSNTTALAYNPATNKLLVGDRSNLIAIINVATGNSEGTLITTPYVGSESYKWNKIRVTEDGVIYGISMTTVANGTCKIYRWKDQNSTPFLCATFTVSERCGDAFGLSGSGMNTVLYASGNGITSSSVNIYVLTPSGSDSTFTLNKTINIPITGINAWAGRSVDPVTTGLNSDIWIRSQNTNTRRINASGAVQFTSTDGTGANQVPSNFANARYFEASNGNKYLAMFGTSSLATGGRQLRVLNITNEASVTDVGADSLTSTFNSNTSGIGDAAIKNNNDGTFTIFYLLTNNGLKAVQTQNLVPIKLSYFTGNFDKENVCLSWQTTNEINNSGFEIQQSHNGNDFEKVGFVYSKAIAGNSNYTINYNHTIKNLQQANTVYYRLKQIDKDGKFTYSKTIALKNTAKEFSADLHFTAIKNSIDFTIFSNKTTQVTTGLYNAQGILLKTYITNIVTGTNYITLATPKMLAGINYVTLTTNDNFSKTYKIIKL